MKMAFGVKKNELLAWKREVSNGKIAILTHYWMDKRFPGCFTVTKVGCRDVEKLILWGREYCLLPEWIHMDKNYPHYDLFGEKQKEVLTKEGQREQLNRFHL